MADSTLKFVSCNKSIWLHAMEIIQSTISSSYHFLSPLFYTILEAQASWNCIHTTSICADCIKLQLRLRNLHAQRMTNDFRNMQQYIVTSTYSRWDCMILWWNIVHSGWEMENGHHLQIMHHCCGSTSHYACSIYSESSSTVSLDHYHAPST